MSEKESMALGGRRRMSQKMFAAQPREGYFNIRAISLQRMPVGLPADGKANDEVYSSEQPVTIGYSFGGPTIKPVLGTSSHKLDAL